MKIENKLIDFDYNFPIKIHLTKVSDVERNWHTTLRILYVLEGKAILDYDNNKSFIKENDMVIINSYKIYELETQKELVYLDVEIYLHQFGFSLSEIEKLSFELNSSVESDFEKFNTLRDTIFGLIKTNFTAKDNVEYLNKALSYQILYLLINNYKVEGNTTLKKSQKNLEKLKEIINYLNYNYNKKITLYEISEKFGYTPQYFSSFFTKNIGQSFQDYFDDLRIQKSLDDLANTDLSLDEISRRSGFADYRSYIRAFKNKFEITPSEYRKKKSDNIHSGYIDNQTFDRKHYLDIIFNSSKEQNIKSSPKKIDTVIDINIDYLAKTQLNSENYLKVMSFSRASDIFKKDIQEVLERSKKDLDFKYLYFDGLLCDDMHLARISKSKGLIYNYSYIDYIFDYLFELDINPFINLSYMPKDLARDKNKVVFESEYISSLPEDISLWLDLVSNLINHLIDRYGTNKILELPITIWNQPDSTSHAFGFDDKEEFFEFYRKTYELIKNINNRFKIGTPNLIPFASFALDFDKEFIKYTKINNCYPDFLNITYFSNDFDFFLTGKKIEKLSKDPNAFKNYLENVREQLDYQGQVYCTHWNITSSQRNLINDSIYSSVSTIKNHLDNLDNAYMIGKWAISDLIDETPLPSITFYGGLGLFTKNNIPKASYYAYYFLSKLKKNIIAKDQSYIITKDNNKMVILIYNYQHYGDLFADGEYFSLQMHSRYEPFLMNKVNKFTFHINNVPYKKARVRVSRITRESGSAYDIYDSMSYIEPSNKKDIDTIKSLSIPKYRLFEQEITNDYLDLYLSVESLEIKLVEIDLIK